MLFRLFPLFIHALLCGLGTNAQREYLRIKFDTWWHIPYSVSEITSVTESDFGNFVLAAHDTGLKVDLYSYVNDTRFLILFDSFGNIGGLRFCYLKSDVGKGAAAQNKTFPFDYSSFVGEFYTEQNYWDTPAWCNDILVTSPTTLQEGGREYLNGFPVEQLWLRLHGTWVAIPEDESEVEALGFVKQGCYEEMGQHYFFEMTPERTCETLVPSTLLFQDGKLIGCNLPTFGAFTSDERVWFESFTREQVASMAPFSNACVLDWIFRYGTCSCHVSFLFNHTSVPCEDN